jgi:sugar (pentulose or hexulose) kinase
MRAQIYSAFATLKIGQDILFSGEGVSVNRMYAHGGIFKDKGIAQRFLAAALNVPVTVNETANEGGPWGMSVLAMFMLSGGGDLGGYLEKKVFAGAKFETVEPNEKDAAGFRAFMDKYIRALPAVKEAVKCLKN